MKLANFRRWLHYWLLLKWLNSVMNHVDKTKELTINVTNFLTHKTWTMKERHRGHASVWCILTQANYSKILELYFHAFPKLVLELKWHCDRLLVNIQKLRFRLVEIKAASVRKDRQWRSSLRPSKFLSPAFIKSTPIFQTHFSTSRSSRWIRS